MHAAIVVESDCTHGRCAPQLSLSDACMAHGHTLHTTHRLEPRYSHAAAGWAFWGQVVAMCALAATSMPWEDAPWDTTGSGMVIGSLMLLADTVYHSAARDDGAVGIVYARSVEHVYPVVVLLRWFAGICGGEAAWELCALCIACFFVAKVRVLLGQGNKGRRHERLGLRRRGEHSGGGDGGGGGGSGSVVEDGFVPAEACGWSGWAEKLHVSGPVRKVVFLGVYHSTVRALGYPSVLEAALGGWAVSPALALCLALCVMPLFPGRSPDGLSASGTSPPPSSLPASVVGFDDKLA